MAKLLWSPSQERVHSSNMFHFMQWINERHGQYFTRYDQLYQWSVEHIADFWESWWHFADIKASRPYDRILDDVSKMPGAKWFEGARLNFAENLLRYRDDRTALVFYGEDRIRRRISYTQLYAAVSGVAEALKAAGVQAGDRVRHPAEEATGLARLHVGPCSHRPKHHRHRQDRKAVTTYKALEEIQGSVASEDHCRSLNCPVSAQRADDIGGPELGQARPAKFECP